MTNEIACKFPTEMLVLFIQTLLSENAGSIVRQTVDTKLTIHLKGVDKKKVQKEIFEWLKVRVKA